MRAKRTTIYPVVGRARRDSERGLYISKYLFSDEAAVKPGLSEFFFQGERDRLAPEEAKQRAASIA